MRLVTTINEMLAISDEARCSGKKIGLVPTMGFLHKAHMALVSRSKNENDITVVTIFVNPTQFAPGEDFDTYPRDMERDKEICRENGVDIIFFPEKEDMYTDAHRTSVNVSDLDRYMCGACREGHFDGVSTIVAKLFNITKPHRAYLGQKDYQQYVIIKRMAEDLNFDLDLVMCDIVREEDGLAMSSRNIYLSEEERQKASSIYRSLCRAKEKLLKAEAELPVIEKELYDDIMSGLNNPSVDYAGIFDVQKLEPVERFDSDVVIAAAVKVGRARLIDNVIVRYDLR